MLAAGGYALTDRLGRTITVVFGCALLTAAHLFGQAAASDQTALRFDVVSVKENIGSDRSVDIGPQPPDGYRQINLDLQSYIRLAYDVHQPQRLLNVPEWTWTKRYDIIGKASGRISDDERWTMVRDVLVSRFHLKAHFEPQDQPVYVMTTARADRKLGPGLTPRPECELSACESNGAFRVEGLEMRAVTLTQLAGGMLSALARQLVIDETGIEGKFDVKASWRPDGLASDPNDTRPSLFTAMQEQLGLKLQAQRRPVEVLVIDGIQPPDPD
jgi:uncharacterized protein (TIGR03435 family)